MPTIICDTRQKLKHHDLKEQYFIQHGLRVLHSKLPIADYARIDDMSVVVDTKQDLLEVVNNICGAEHERFRRECLLAKENGIKLIVLVEEDQTDPNGQYVVNDIRDVWKWKNPRLDVYKTVTVDGVKKRIRRFPKATTGVTLMKAMLTMQKKYDVEFQFCRKKDAGRKVMEILRLCNEERE